jgi:hypothetical protein
VADVGRKENASTIKIGWKESLGETQAQMGQKQSN